MKKTMGRLVLMVGCLGLLSNVGYAQTFLNSNVGAENELVVCDDAGSSSGTTACNTISSPTTADAHSIHCGLIDNDAYLDCVVATAAETDDSAGDTIDFGWLRNLGTSATQGSNQFDTIINVTLPNFGGADVFVRHGTLLVRNQTPTGLTGATVSTGIDGSNGEDPIIIGVDTPFAGGSEIMAMGFSASSGFSEGTLAAASSDTAAITSGTQNPINLYSTTTPTTAGGEKSAALFDCDGDGDLDVAVAVRTGSGPFGVSINASINTGSSLADVAAANVSATNFSENPLQGASLTVGNFNSSTDSIPDIALAVNGPSTKEPLHLCTGTGTADACTFTCSEIVDLRDLVGGSDFDPASITSGDFDGDGFQDVAIAGNTGALGVISYIFGTGATLDSSTAVNATPTATGFTTLTVGQIVAGFFNTDTVADVAYTMYRTSGTTPGAMINVILSTGNRSLGSPEELPYTSSAEDHYLADALDAVELDRCGGDDIVALYNHEAVGANADDRMMAVWWNQNETPTAAISSSFPDGQVGLGGQTTLTATCVDSTQDPMTYTWSSSCSEGSGTFATSSGTIAAGTVTNDVSATFTGDVAGSCTITLTCADPCGASSTNTTTINILSSQVCGDGAVQGSEACDSGVSGGSSTCSASCTIQFGGAPAYTQGGTLWSCSLARDSDFANRKENLFMWGSFGILLFVFFRRLKKRSFLVLFFLVLFTQPGYALTNSFSINNFKPTIDDSDFFTVYTANTLRKRDFHVGLWLDYAKDPYEFGNSSFSRVSGIVDHLVTANIVGSYGVLDWFNVGVRVPVYLVETINAPLLSLDESNVALGDVELVTKFRLLDREEHRVGISVMPFVTFPTSTDSRDYLGNGSFSGGARLILDTKIVDRVTLALNVGYEIRKPFTDSGGLQIDDRFLAGLGVGVDIIKYKLKFIAEADTTTVAEDFFSVRRKTPLEVRAGIRYVLADRIDLNLGGAMGLTNGVGSPEFRILAGASYTKRPLASATLKDDENEVTIGDELTSKVSDRIYFEYDSEKIRDISRPTLDKVAAFIKAHPEITAIRIEGHTCDLGGDAYNKRLSQKRAEAVRSYMISQGVPASIMKSIGFGEANPMVENKDEPSREQNRRVQMFVEAITEDVPQTK